MNAEQSRSGAGRHRAFRSRLTFFILAGGFLFAGLVHLPPSSDFSFCPIRLSTGIRCPGCGIGESVMALAKGHVADGVKAHAMGPVVFVFLAYHAFASFLAGFAKYELRVVRRESTRRILSWSAVAGFGAVFAVRGVAFLSNHVPW